MLLFHVVIVGESFRRSPINLYVGQVIYEVKQQNEWLMKFMVAQRLNPLIKVTTIDSDPHNYK